MTKFCAKGLFYPLILLLFALQLVDLSTAPHAATTDSDFVILLMGSDSGEDGEVMSLIESSVRDLSVATRLEKSQLPKDLRNQEAAIIAGRLDDKIQVFLRSKGANLAILLSDREKGLRSEGIKIRLIGFPVEDNYPDFPPSIVNVPIVREKAYVSPILNLRVSQAIANSNTPSPRNPTRYAALLDYGDANRALDPCAPVGGFSNQLLILGKITAPTQQPCDGVVIGEALSSQSRIASEYADVLTVGALARLSVRLSESMLLLGIRSMEPRLLDKSIEVAEKSLSLEVSFEAEISLIQGLILRGKNTKNLADLDRSVSIIESRLPTEDRSEFLYYAALSTALFERYRLSESIRDLRQSVNKSRSALRLQSPAATIDVHLLLRVQLAARLFELGEQTGESKLKDEAKQEAEFVQAIALKLSHGELAAYAKAAVN